MFTKAILLAAMIAFVEARFGQEQAVTQILSSVQGGPPGVAQTIAGGAISTLLAAANPCDKLKVGDNIIAQLGTGADAIAAAIAIVSAEQNFNPFATDRPTFCADATLPKSAQLRGITPLVDPAVDGADLANKLSAQSQAKPFAADGLSVAQVIAAQGFTTFNTKDAAGTAGPTGDELAGGATPPASDNSSSDDSGAEPAASSAAPAASTSCVATVTVTASAPAATETGADNADDSTDDNAEDSTPATGSGDGLTTSSLGLDFGKCIPAVKFVGGLGGRPATEFTFQSVDPKISAIQQEALNPAIIFNRICDELTNQCAAAQDAKDACRAAQKSVDASVRNASTAEAWNAALGFADVDVSAGGAAPAPAGGAAPADPSKAVDSNPNVEKSTIAGLDFGSCVPTVKFVGGLGNRPATEFTFQSKQASIAAIQQEALNPAIIFNRICDELTNQCAANQAAKDACRAAQKSVDATVRNASTAVAWNTALGFADADVNSRRRAIEGIKRRSARYL
jgi:hypothetical protein